MHVTGSGRVTLSLETEKRAVTLNRSKVTDRLAQVAAEIIISIIDKNNRFLHVLTVFSGLHYMNI